MSMLEHDLHGSFGARLETAPATRRFTSFRIGGPADLYLAVETETELGEREGRGLSQLDARFLPGRMEPICW